MLVPDLDGAIAHGPYPGNATFHSFSHFPPVSPDGRPGGFVPTASPVGTAGFLVHLTGTILDLTQKPLGSF